MQEKQFPPDQQADDGCEVSKAGRIIATASMTEPGALLMNGAQRNVQWPTSTCFGASG
jgi:hypothetical protein